MSRAISLDLSDGYAVDLGDAVPPYPGRCRSECAHQPFQCPGEIPRSSVLAEWCFGNPTPESGSEALRVLVFEVAVEVPQGLTIDGVVAEGLAKKGKRGEALGGQLQLVNHRKRRMDLPASLMVVADIQ